MLIPAASVQSNETKKAVNQVSYNEGEEETYESVLTNKW